MDSRMNDLDEATRTKVLSAVCRELLALAKQEDDTAASEASSVPYWCSLPTSVVGHRAAARSLRRAAEDADARVRAAELRARVEDPGGLAQAS